MRSSFSLVVLVLAVALAGCLGGGGSIEGPTTIGDQGHTVWQISDGLCGDGIFGSECDLGQRIAVSASPTVQIRGRNGTSLEHATLVGGPNVTVTGSSTSTDDQGTLLSARVGSEVAGVGDVIVLDGAGAEIDRVHITFVAAASIVCGPLTTAVTRDYTFPGLVSSSTVDVTMMAGETSTSTTLACRATDASGNAMLTVNAIRWSLAAGSEGTIMVRSDDLLGSTPAVGATARVVTMGAGTGTVHVMLGTATADIAVTFH
jgi:hypothetical protein